MSSIAMFYYVWTLGVIILAGSALSLSCFLVSHQKHYLFLCIMMLVYYFDIALVARTDFTTTYTVAHLYRITDPVESTLSGGLLIGSMWAAFLSYAEKNWHLAWVPVLAFATCSFSTLAIPSEAVREFAFFSMRGLGVITILSYMLVHYIMTADPVEKIRLKVHAPLWGALVVLCISGFVWNIILMLYLPSIGFDMSTLGFLPEHSMIENLFYVVWVAYAVKVSVQVLSLHFNTPPLAAAGPKSYFVLLATKRFAHDFNLSEREEEIMSHLIDGEGRQEIANKLVLSPSTIKVHVHNILKKTNTTTTKDLLKRFWNNM